jgi:glycosyltransferase involved in cell wall biosynthesis
MKRKVLYIDAPLDPPGGGQVSLLALLANLDPAEVAPRVLLSSGGTFAAWLEKAGIPFEIVSTGGLPGRMAAFGPDLVHCNSATCRYTLAAALCARLLGVPFLWHNRVLQAAGWKERLIARLSCRIIVISGAVGARFSWCAGKVSKLYNAADTARFAPAAPSAALRSGLGLGESGPVIGVFSRLEPWKGQELFLRAAARLPESFPGGKLRFLLAGEGPDRRRLGGLAGELGLAERVVFSGFREDMPALMNLCGIVVNPSVEPEPFGRTIIEAMACGRPVVATAGGGPEEIITDGTDGLLVPPEAGALAAAMLSLLPGGRLASAGLGEKARRKAVERFGVKAQGKALLGIYEEAAHAG